MIEPFRLKEELEGKNVRLVKRRHEFDSEMLDVINANRAFLRPYLFWVDKTRGREDVAAATRHFNESWAAQTKFAYALIDKHSGKLLGSIDVHDIDLTNRTAAIGYWLRKDKTGFGYMSDAVQTLVRAVFDKGVRRLEITCDSLNRASAGVALRNGFEYEGTQREAIYTYGEFHDREVYVRFNRK